MTEPIHPSSPSLLPMNEAVFIRTVTHFFTGRITAISDKEVRLDDAAWIADTGRFAEALATGKLSDVEPYPSFAIVNRESIVDCSLWMHELPRKVK